MSKASDLIDRMEKEAGYRVDNNNHDNPVMYGLIGAMARELGIRELGIRELGIRELGISEHESRDDVAAGAVIKHQKSPEEIEKIKMGWQ